MSRRLAALAFGVLGIFALELLVVQSMKPLENRLLDAFVKRQAASVAPDPDVVLVTIDEKSLARMEQIAGRFPWPRAVYATLLDGLAPQRPRAIVFDILFSEADKVQAESDREFVEAALRHSGVNIYYPMVRLDTPHGARASQLAPLLGLVRGPGADPEARLAVIPPLVLPPKLWRTGTINFLPDDDGVGRRYELRTRVGGWDLPSLPARVAMDLGFPVPDANDVVLAWRSGAEKLPRVSFSDLYEDVERSSRKRPRDEFTGKIVVVGVAAAGLGDLRLTPLSPAQPGIEILATAIENLKNGRAMHYAPPWWPAAIGIALVTLLCFSFYKGIDMRASGAALAVATALAIAGQWMLVGRLVLLPLLVPLAAAWTFYAAAALAEYLRERSTRFLRQVRR
jgi:adenylate cyclase